jgi:site-specific DNA-methyltransferase (adenine-specific)
MLNSGMMSSNKENWETPQQFFDQLNNKYHFTWDLALA